MKDWIYEKYCVGCQFESLCHETGELCDSVLEALEEKKK